MKTMNYKKIVFGLGIAFSIGAIQSCDKIKDFKDLNTDPNRTVTPIPSALLTNVESGMGANLVFDAGGINTGAGLYSQLYAETQYTEVSRYNKPSYNYDTYFTGPIEDLQKIINYNSDAATVGAAANYGSNKNQIAIARILKAHYVKFLTDAVGDIPYFNTLKGDQGVITATYDKQQDIYKDLLKELKEAVEQFDNGSTVQGDIIFGGDVTKWKRYANSLRFLLALNMAKADNATAKSEAQAALSGGVITSNSDNVTINYVGGNFPNPFYNYYVLTQRLDFAVSKTLTDQLANTSDPRLNVYASSSKGFPYGLTRDNAIAFSNANTNWARLFADSYRQTNSPLTIIGAANMYLARAEAAQRGLTTESAAAMYTAGVQASFDQWRLGSAATFLAASAVALNGTNDLQKIATQEWVAWFPNGLEAWNVVRRTGFPVLTPAPGLTAIPRRTPYGTNDYAYNSANVTAAAARYTVGGTSDSQYGKVWWDQ
jgi:Starch-binding associating with outer membrane